MLGFSPDSALSESELKASNGWYPGHRVQQSFFPWIKVKVGSLLGKLTVKANFVAGHENPSESLAAPCLYTVIGGFAPVWGALSCYFFTCSPISRQFLKLGGLWSFLGCGGGCTGMQGLRVLVHDHGAPLWPPSPPALGWGSSGWVWS